MADDRVLYVFHNLYEPQQENGKWVVNYRKETKWEKETCDSRESAVEFYKKKTKELWDYYNRFLQELRMSK